MTFFIAYGRDAQTQVSCHHSD